MWGDTLTLDIETRPLTATGEVHIWWLGPHTVAADSSTVPARLEQVVIEGTCAHLLSAWFINALNTIQEALAQITAAETALGLMAAKVATGFTQLGTADGNLDTNYPKITTLITELGDEITLLVGDIATSRAALGGNMTNALAAAALINSGAAGAVTESDSSMNRGQYFINRINVGGGVPDEWLSNARTELGLANVYAAQAHAYIAADRQYLDTLHSAGAELNAVNAIMQKLKATSEQSSPMANYGALMSKYNEAAAAGIMSAQGHLQSMAGRLQTGNVMANFSKMADIKLEAWKRSLHSHKPYRVNKMRSWAD